MTNSTHLTADEQDKWARAAEAAARAREEDTFPWAPTYEPAVEASRLAAANADEECDDLIIERALHAATNAACKVIQDALGVATGDFAATWFDGMELPELENTLAAYLDDQRVDRDRQRAIFANTMRHHV
jgi:hypothetical protein